MTTILLAILILAALASIAPALVLALAHVTYR